MALPTNRTARIADRVGALMKTQGLTPYQLADRAKVPRTTLGYRLVGSGEWSVEMLYRLGLVLGFTPSEILDGIEEDA